MGQHNNQEMEQRRICDHTIKRFNEGWRRNRNTLQLGGMSAGNTTKMMGLDIDLKLEKISKKKESYLDFLDYHL